MSTDNRYSALMSEADWHEWMQSTSEERVAKLPKYFYKVEQRRTDEMLLRQSLAEYRNYIRSAMKQIKKVREDRQEIERQWKELSTTVVNGSIARDFELT